MYAIVETAGKQYKVTPGETLRVEKLSLEKGSEIILDKVLMLSQEDKSIYGSPYISGAKDSLLFTSLSSIGLPGLNGFVGEFLILTGAFK